MAEPSSVIRGIEQRGNATVVTVAGDVDLQQATVFQQQMLGLLDRKPPLVVIDLTDVPYMDSSGVASLVKVLSRSKKQNTSLKLAGLNPRVRGIFEITRLDTVFQMTDTVDEALASA